MLIKRKKLAPASKKPAEFHQNGSYYSAMAILNSTYLYSHNSNIIPGTNWGGIHSMWRVIDWDWCCVITFVSNNILLKKNKKQNEEDKNEK